jgi:retinol dehydrogenase 12
MSSSVSPTMQPIALITGANTGIGLVTACELAKAGFQVFIACRSVASGIEAVKKIKEQSASSSNSSSVESLVLDLGDFESIRQCASTFLEKNLPLHLLINNAGLAGQKGFTKSGFELAFGVNHIGHFLLTQLLLDRIRASGPARIVTVASNAHFRSTGLDWDACKKPTSTLLGLKEYAGSKLANVLFSAELARRLAGSTVKTYSLHPGVVASDIWRKIPWPISVIVKRNMLTTEDGAKTSLYCALSPAVASDTGLYYDKCQVKSLRGLGLDANLAAELWRRSEEWVSRKNI